MELGLSLGDAPSKGGGSGLSTTLVNKTSLGLCMSLNGTSHQQMDEKPHSQDDGDDDFDDGEEHEKDDQKISKEHEGIREVIIGSDQRISPLNPPVQLDLLPSAPVLRHISVPWSPDNGSSEGGSSGNAATGRGFDVRKMRVGMVTEEATSSFRLEFKNKNHKRGFELGNEVDVERASDEEDNGMSRKKLRLSKEQSAYLEETFKKHNTLNPKQKLALAEQLNLRPRQVEVWFQNRRARTKLKQTEMDYEYLKRCCESLTEENRRLHKELQEVRAIKTSSNPGYMELPATTLTMCPSCEHVNTTSKKHKSTPLTHSPKPKSLNYPVSYTPHSSNSHQQPEAPSS